MSETIDMEDSDTLAVEGDAKSSARVLSAIRKAQDTFRDYQDTCARIDDIYSREGAYDSNWLDPQYDLLWSSMEILKPAIYAHSPVPAVAPMFSDRRPLYNLTAELLERTALSAFERANIDQAMLTVRDDLAFTNRGILWVTYESEDGQRVCIDAIDRTDFLHEPARTWAEVGWVARRAWMTRGEMRKRFRPYSGDAYMKAKTEIRRDDKNNGGADDSKKAGVWEVWHKADNKVYWVAPECPVMLDHGEPHLDLKDFFPCPRPAYGTLRRRSLVPVPDYIRYASHLDQINKLTSRIYKLLDRVKMKGLIPAGGDIGDAVELAMSNDDDELLIPVPGAALISGSSTGFVTWLPIKEIAEAITGLIAARGQLIEDFYQLSGISDIMRGATEAEETLGAQQLKSQYGSVRVRDKIDELQRLARDVARIVSEVAAEKFTKDTLLDMSLMDIPTKADISKQIKEIEDTAKGELQGVRKQAQEAAQQAQQSGQQVDPAQAEQQFQQAQQEIIAKYAPQLKQAEESVPLEDVIDLLRDDRARGFAFEIETDSTILTDEMQEKQQRAEFLTAVSGAITSLMGMAALGEQGAALAGGLLKFSTAPYRVGRELNSLIDDFVDAAPQMAAAAAQQGQGDDGLAEANAKLAEAELMKAQAQGQNYQAQAQLKMQELTLQAGEAEAKAQQDRERFGLEIEQTKGTLAETNARIEKIMAEIQKMGVDAQNQTRQQDREDVKATADIEMRATEQVMQAQDADREAQFRAQEGQRAERQQSFSERQGERAENRADRQQQFAERQPPK